MSKISSRKQSKRAIAFVLAILMLFNQNLLLKTSAEESVGTVPTLTYLYQETFEGTSLPTGFSGKGTIDTESKVLKIKELGDTDISITPVEGVNKYTIEFDMMRVDEYDASTNNFIQLKMYDSSNTEICMYNTSFANLRIAYMDGTRKYRELQNDSEIYVVEKGNWATYKYEVDVAEKTIVLTVTDKDGNVYVDNNATQSPFYGNGNDLAKFQFKVPRTNGVGAASEAEYSVDNFKVYYEIPQDLDGEGDEDSGSNGTVEIPEGTTAIYQESFEGTALPTGFSGKGTIDTESKVLKIKELGDTDISITPVEGVNKYTIEFDMVRVDEYDASTNNYIQLKMYDSSNAEICMYNTSNANLRIAYMDGTRKYRELQNDSEIYVVEKGNWATYKYEVDVAEKTIVLTVTDKDGNVYVDNNATQSPFYGSGSDLAKFQFKVPSKNGANATNEAEYSVDNFKVYYEIPQDSGNEGDGNDSDTTDNGAPTIVEIPADATKILQEAFNASAQSTAFTGAFVLDTDKDQLNIAGVAGGTTAKVTFGKIDEVDKYTIEFDMKRTDEDNSGYMQMKYFDSVGTELSLSDTRYQTFRLRDKSAGTVYNIIENYEVTTGNWAHYKYELDMDSQQITVTITDNANVCYTSLSAAFDVTCENVYEMQFYIPNAGSAAKYSIDNFVAYYTGGVTGGGDDGVVTNFITNAGFETVNENPGDGFTGMGAQGWSKHGNWGTSNIRELDSEVKHSGEYSMKLGGGALTDQVVIRQTVNGLIPDKYYKLSGYIKTENYYPAAASKPVGPVLRIDSSSAASMYWVSNIPITAGTENTNDWTYTEIVFTPGTEQVYLSCRMEYGSGLVWYDDLSLVEYEPCVSVAMSQNSATLSGGEELQLSAAPYPAKEGAVIKWSSSNTEIATVDGNGKVTASTTKSGEAVITATVTEQICTKSTNVSSVDVTDYCKVVVNAGESVASIEEVKVDIKNISLVLGESDATINLITIPASAKETTEFVWTTSDSSVAVVTDGYVVPVGEGTAIVTASVKGDKTIADYCEVVVTKKESASFEVSDFVIQENSEFDRKIQESGYPKLLFSYEDIASIRQKAKSSHTAYTFTKMEEYADSLLTSETLTHANIATGGRILQSYLTNLVMTGYIKQDMEYIDRAIEIMLASANEYTVDEYYAMNAGLSLGDAAQAYAIGYDWLYPFMTEEEKTIVVGVLDGLGTKLSGLTTGYDSAPGTGSNHSAVIYGGLGLVGLVRQNNSWIEKATEVVTEYLQISSDETGFYNEGTDYMMYGALGAVTYSAALQRATGVDLIEHYSYMEENMDMLLYYFLPDRDSVLPIGDSYGTLCPMGSWMYLISKYQNAVSLWQYLEMTGAEGTQLYGLAESEGKGASAAYILIWADTSLEAKAPVEENTPVVKEFEWGYNVYRDGWDDDLDTLISFVSGKTAHRGHNQRDENSFAFYAKGEDFAIDPGYSPSETLSHNALLVDGVGQAVPGDQYDIYGEIIKSQKLADNIYYVEGDATDTYPDRVSIASYVRRMLVCTGDIPYIIVIDDIDKANDVKSNYSWLLQTSKTNKLLVEGNSAQIIGSNKGSVMDIQFPFGESVFLNIDPWATITVGGAQGNYVPSGYSKTLEAVIPGADKRIVSVLTARGFEEFSPVIETTGTPDNGTITLSYYDGKADVITLSGNTISYQQVDIEILDKPETQEPLTKEEIDAIGGKSITLQISGNLQDFERISIENNAIVVDVEEFISVFEKYTALDETMKGQLRSAASNGNILLDTTCDIISANYSYNSDLKHITVMVKEDVYKVTGSDINISGILEDKISIQGIDTRTDEVQYPPQNAIDGELDTYFTIQGNTGEAVILELDTEYEIYAVGIAFNQGSKRISRFDIQVSIDKENWETVRCAASSGSTEGVEGYSFAKTNAKYVRFLGYGNSVNEWNAIREIEIYGKTIEVDPTPDPTPTPESAPEIIDQGTVEVYSKGSNVKVSIHCTGDLTDFAGVWINNQELDPSNYTVTAGSIIVTLHPEYVETLSEGNHVFTIKFTNGTSVDSQLTIQEQKTDEVGYRESDESDIVESAEAEQASSPSTGDSSHLLLWMILLSAVALVSILVARKMKQEK